MGTAKKVDALGKNRDKASEQEDYAKQQSDKSPAAENLDMMPNSVSKAELEEGENNNDKKEEISGAYADSEHKRAEKWEDHSAKDRKKHS